MSSKRRRDRGSEPAVKKRVPRIQQVEVLAKTDGQQHYIKCIEDSDIIVCDGKAGTGKAQPLDAIVYTPAGPKRMGSIKVGDEVLTPNGGSAKVLGVYPQGKIPVYSIRFSDGTSTEACGDHLWFTQTVLERNQNKPGKVRTTKEIAESLFYGEKKNHSIGICEPVYFESKNVDIDPYVLGILIGDGHLRTNAVFFSSSDNEIVENISNFSSSVSLSVKKRSKYDYAISNNKRGQKNLLLSELQKLGLAGKKSYEKFIPNDFKYNSIEVRLEILRGLLDSDGSISEQGHIEYSTTSPQLVEDVRFLVESLGSTLTVVKRQTFYSYKGEKKPGRESFRLNICMNPELNPFKLARKASRYIPHTKYPPRRFITNVELVGEKEAQCIFIDSDEHLYLTNNFIVTHNTLLAVGMAIKLLRDYPETYNRIIMVRPAVSVQGEDLGFLPGGIDEKMHPFMIPMLDSMRYFMDEGAIATMMGHSTVEIIPVAFIRGRTLNNTVVIFDEAQNSTPLQMKTFLTRMGFNTKAIIEGDVTQSDLTGDKGNGLEDAMHRLDGVEGVSVVRLTSDDVVRSPIVARILKRYDE